MKIVVQLIYFWKLLMYRIQKLMFPFARKAFILAFQNGRQEQLVGLFVNISANKQHRMLVLTAKPARSG